VIERSAAAFRRHAAAAASRRKHFGAPPLQASRTNEGGTWMRALSLTGVDWLKMC